MCLFALAFIPLIVDKTIFSPTNSSFYMRSFLVLASILFIIEFFSLKSFRNSVIEKIKKIIKNPLVISVLAFILISIIAIAILAIVLFSGSSIFGRKEFWLQTSPQQGALEEQKREQAIANPGNSISKNNEKLTANVEDTLPVDLLAKLGEKKVARVETTEKVIALTFDADIYSRAQEEMARKREVSFYDKKLISFLEEEKIRATLFLSGLWIEAYPKTTEELAQNPLFEIGNHSYSHPSFIKKCFNMPPIPNSQDREQIEKTEELLKKHAPNFKKYFRFPDAR